MPQMPPPNRRDPREEAMIQQQMAQGQPIPGSPPVGSMPPGDPSMMGGDPNMDPALMGGDPSMMEGDPNMDPAMMEGDPSMMGGDPSQQVVEPYSVQLWRRIHGDKKDLLSEYHNLLQPLEHEPSKALMVKLLQAKAMHLDDIENHWLEHYKDFPPLDGMMIAYDDAALGHEVDPHTGKPIQGDKDTTVRELDEGSLSPIPQRPDVPAEEAVAGMRTKKKSSESKKSGGKGEKSLSFFSKTVKDKNKEEDEDDDKEEKGKDEDDDKEEKKGKKKKADKEESDDDEDTGEVGEGNPVEMTDENSPTPPEVPHPHSLPDTLKDHELSAVVDTGEFLKNVGTSGSPWDEQTRFDSYHYGKTLNAIGAVIATGSLSGEDPDIQVVGPEAAEQQEMRDSKVSPSEKEWVENNNKQSRSEKKGKAIQGTTGNPSVPTPPAAQPAGVMAHNSHRKMCKDCGDFLIDLSKQALIGDSHRAKAMDWHKNLSSIGIGPSDPGMTGNDVASSGEMGEKALTLNFLEAAAEKQHDQLNTLLKTVEGLTKVLKKA